MLKRLFKFIGVIILLGAALFGVLYYCCNEPLPIGESGPEADALAERMLSALNNDGYQNTTMIEWTFRGGDHTYKWDKEKAVVKVGWDDYRVDLDLITPDSSTAYEKGEKLPYEETLNLIDKAKSYFNNDSFWLVAPYKVFDKGTERYLVELEDGSEGLLVTYTQGGDTPGDSYLWLLERSGIPKSFKLWVKIIPIGGLEATWEGWQKTESGALLPSSHSFGPITMKMGDVKTYH
ncbi:hypothetical protein ACNR9Q_13150 [Maribacter sp. X9]|uniref:hypothetical protein n=1 Tax=Maribacter sp. X9 TaxID=3402159 RepID=UPI003AF3FE0E